MKKNKTKIKRENVCEYDCVRTDLDACGGDSLDHGSHRSDWFGFRLEADVVVGLELERRLQWQWQAVHVFLIFFLFYYAPK